MADPEVSSNNTEYQKLVRAVSDIQVGPADRPAKGPAKGQQLVH